jgi:hypothetical protein
MLKEENSMYSPLGLLAARRTRMMRGLKFVPLLSFVLSIALANSAWAQTFTMDARMVGMGGANRSNVSASLTEDSKSYRSIGLPLGLIQLYRHRQEFDPSDRVNFNPLRVIEDLSNPLHYTFGRESESQGDKIVKDLVNGDLSRNLLDYKGYTPKSPLAAQGLYAPSLGKTFRLGKVGKFSQGIYVGAGPYLTAGTSVVYDPALLNAWSGATSSIPADSSLLIHNNSSGQAAVQAIAGYQARFEAPKALKSDNPSNRDGIYVAVNYHYIHGFHYDTDTIDARFDTDSTGLIALAIPATSPVTLDRLSSNSGRGRAVDLGTNVITGRWEFQFGADGLGNQITWSDMAHEQITLSALLSGLDFVTTTLPAPMAPAVVKLPVQYSAGSAYHAQKWTVLGHFSRRLNGPEYHAGAEYRLGPLAFRGGGRYSKDIFNPTGGVGFNLTSHFGIDAALFTNSANAQQDRRVSTALSLRFQ